MRVEDLNALFPSSLSDSPVSGTPPNVVTAEVSSPAGIMDVPAVVEACELVLTEGVAKGGYPVDIAAQSTIDLTSIGQPESGCPSALIEPGLEPAADAQLEMSYAALDTQESYSEEQDFPSITEVIRPMEMAELVHILPTLSLIEEETPSSLSTSSVMEMLESFGLGISENSTFFDLENSNLTNGAGCLSQPSQSYASSSSSSISSMRETHCENTVLQGQDMSACHGLVSATGGDGPVLSREFPPEAQQVPSKGACFLVRNQVEWDRPSNSSS